MRTKAYEIELTEFRLKPSIGTNLSNGEIEDRFAKLIAEGSVQSIRTTRLSAVPGVENVVRVEQHPADKLNGKPQRVRHPAERPDSVAVKVTPIPLGEKIEMNVFYEVARSNDDGTERLPSSMEIHQATVTKPIELEKPTMIAEKFGKDRSYLILKIQH